MDRRTFVLLTGAASTAVLHPARAGGRSSGRTAGRLRFELDDHRRWSLWYYGDGPPVPLFRAAELVTWVGDRPVTLAELEDSAVGSRRPPSGDAVVVRGRAAGVWVEAEFLTMGGDDMPQASVTVTLFPDRYLPTVKGVRFFRLPPDETLPGEGALSVLIDGLHSEDACRIVTLGAADATDVTSFGAAGLSRGGRGLGLAFDSEDPGEACLRLSPDGLEAVSDWRPARPLRPEGDASRLRVCLAPAGDGLQALRTLFIPPSPVDQERLARAVAPTGWCSRSELGSTVDEAAVLANADFCAAHFDRRFFRHVELDDGYQRAAGDWDPNERFPHGHAWLSDQIHARGFKAGLWLAPFAVAEGSGVPAAHPDWLLSDEGGPVVCATRDDWGGKVYALDGAHPKVQQWLQDLASRVVRQWGYDYLRVDGLRWATVGTAHFGGLTHAEAYRAGLGAIRDGLGGEASLLAGGAPLQHSIGLVDAMRIGPDVDATWAGLQAPASATGLRSFYHRSAWLNDSDCLVVRPPLSPAAAELWASIVAITGGLTFLSDDLPKLPPDRVQLLQRTLPAAPVAGRPAGGSSSDPERPPRTWIVEGSPQWWTLCIANWADEPLDLSLPLSTLGVNGSRFDVYDVWRDAPAPPVKDVLAVTLDPRTARTLAIRPAVARPQIIGTTRHVVQGALDIGEEKWDPAGRKLRAKATNLDARPYAVTIAVPKGMRPGACQADVPCTVTRLESGHAVLRWEGGGDGRDIAWELAFKSAPRR